MLFIYVLISMLKTNKTQLIYLSYLMIKMISNVQLIYIANCCEWRETMNT